MAASERKAVKAAVCLRQTSTGGVGKKEKALQGAEPGWGEEHGG